MKKFISVFVLLLMATTGFVQAQPTEENSCSFYFDNTQIKFEMYPDNISYLPGDPVILKGSVHNQSTYLLKDVSVRARVLFMNAEQSYIVDEFDVVSSLTLNPDIKKDLEYTYLLPMNYSGGEYKIIFFLTDSKNTDISGLSYTQTIVSESLSFSVESEESILDLIIDSQNILVNDVVVLDQDYATVVSNQFPLKVQIPIQNNSLESKETKITYSIYKNDFVSEKNKVEHIEKIVSFDPEQTKITEFDLEDFGYASYVIVTKVEGIDDIDNSILADQSISYTRIMISEKINPKISLGMFNLSGGVTKNTSFLTCLQAIGFDQFVYPAKIETTITNSEGKELSKDSRQLDIVGLDNGFISQISKKFIKSDFNVNIKIYDTEGNVLDEMNQSYSCQDFGGTCGGNSNMISYLTSIILVSCLVLFAFIIKKRSNINSL